MALINLIPSRMYIMEHVINQLPSTLRDKFTVDITSDAYMMRSLCVLTEKAHPDHHWRVTLERGPLPGYDAAFSCRLPDEFLARLCALF